MLEKEIKKAPVQFCRQKQENTKNLHTVINTLTATCN